MRPSTAALALFLLSPTPAWAGTILEGDHIRIQYNDWGGWNDDSPEYSGLMIRAAATDAWLDDVTIPGSPWQQNNIEFAWNGTTYECSSANYASWGGDGSPWYDPYTGGYATVTETDISSGTTNAIRHDWHWGPFDIEKDESFEESGKVIQITWTFTNTSAYSVSDFRIMHAFDPDMDVFRYGTYDTYNDSIDISGDGINDFVYSEGWESGWTIAYGGCELAASDIGHADWESDSDVTFYDMNRGLDPLGYSDVTMHWRYRNPDVIAAGETVSFSARLIWDVTLTDAIAQFVDTSPECGLCDIDSDGYDAIACEGADCDDADFNIYPGATEIPGDGVDQDCDGTDMCFEDLDGDGWGSTVPVVSTDTDCDDPGEADDDEDCDDTDPTVNPDAEDIAGDGIDSDCDGQEACYVDADEDGYGVSDMIGSPDGDCADPGESTTTDDCYDYNPTIHPGAPETVGDGVDQDCDGLDACYEDLDGDGWGSPATVPSADGDCSDPGESLTDEDCDDDDAATHPEASEIPADGVDGDCDGVEDCWYDADRDTWGTDTVRTSVDLDCDDAYESWNADDCDPGSRSTYPGAPEKPADGVDQDCDGTDACYEDADGDGWGTAATIASDDLDCTDPGESTSGTDCDDGDPGVNPGASEIPADGVDQDCDGEETCWRDGDGDDWGTPVMVVSMDLDCVDTMESTTTTDCDDANAAIHPGATDYLGDGIDQDCDGLDTCYEDADGDGYGSLVEVVSADLDCTDPGEATNTGDCDDARADRSPAETEVCDGIDNDCDGSVDEPDAHDATTWYRDADEDGYGDPSDIVRSCVETAGYVASSGDCDDTAAAIFPGAAEVCNGLDDDCDGSIDEGATGATTTWYHDGDGDGWGDPSHPLEACGAPVGYVSDDTDCDDAVSAVHPGADELCDGLDNDCDGAVDEAGAVDTATWYADTDGDGYGDATRWVRSCEAPTGTVSNSSDCDDSDASVNPAATETCNGVDDDCDGETDEAGGATWYQDLDGDGFGDAAAPVEACIAPDGTVADATDCDDTRPEANPDGVEVCNGLDDDCDGAVDDGSVGEGTWYRDADGDGFGDAGDTVTGCEAPEGYVASRIDCDDDRATVHPGAEETCNGLDDDCDGTVDEDDAVDAATWYADTDGDGFGDPTTAIAACDEPTGFVTDDTDCDDTDATVNPDAEDLPYDGVDSDCSGDDTCDADGDGWDAVPCGGEDCDDDDASIRPDATETWYDGVDADCDGASDFDQDGDGQDSDLFGGTDCDDTDPAVYEGAPELADGIDNDCDGLVEDDDRDGDGLTNLLEETLGSNPDDPDTDDDGVWDGDESGGAALPGDLPDEDGDGTADVFDPDDDGDGVATVVEVEGFDPTDPTDAPPDTDGDGRPDYLDTDSDDDGVGDALEVTGDTDTDQVPDRLDDDDDDDGLPTSEEIRDWDWTDPSDTAPDTDADGTPDYLDTDSDDDGLSDATEDQDQHTDPYDADSDDDGLDDGEEVISWDTNPNDADTDDGGVPDGEEADRGSDPLDGSDDFPAEDSGDTGVGPEKGRYTGGVCGCASTRSAGSPAWLAIAGGLLGLALLRRRRSVLGVAAIAASISAPASAQDTITDGALPALNVDQLRPSADATHFLFTEESTLLKDRAFFARGLLRYARDPLVYFDTDDVRTSLVKDVVQLDVMGGWVLGPVRLALGAPVYLRSTSDVVDGQTGLGDLFLDGKARFLDASDGGPGVFATARASLPTSTMDASLGTDGVNWEATGGVDGHVDAWVLAANVGFRGAPVVHLENLDWGSQVFARLGATYGVSERTHLGMEVLTATGVADAPTLASMPMEFMVGGRQVLDRDRGLVLRGGIGHGITQSISTPTWRLVLGIGFERAEEPDLDLDGIVDRKDACPDRAEDRDTVDDTDGCPDPTSVTVVVVDQDGKPVKNAAWRLGDHAGTGDGLLQTQGGTFSLHAEAPAYRAADLTVTIPDARDHEVKATLVLLTGNLKVLAEGKVKLKGEKKPRVVPLPQATWQVQERPDLGTHPVGEPRKLPIGTWTIIAQAPDWRDVSKVIEVREATEETLSFEMAPARAVVKVQQIEIKEKVFFETNLDVLKPESVGLLDEVAEILVHHPELLQIRIEGHTDSRADDTFNLDLSQRRAEAVKRHLVSKGVAETRLEAVGYGETRPLAKRERNREDEAKNRRVEFHVVKREGGDFEIQKVDLKDDQPKVEPAK